MGPAVAGRINTGVGGTSLLFGVAGDGDFIDSGMWKICF